MQVVPGWLRTASWVVIVVVVAAAAASWFTPRPDLDADDAGAVALGALDHLGIAGSIDREIVLTDHTLDNGETVEAWVVFVDVDGTEIELRVQESVGQLVWVDDNIGDGVRLLTDEEFERLDAYVDDTVVDRWETRNVAGSIAAGMIGVVCFVIATRAEKLGDTEA